jgi:hypothetical protein
METQVSHELFPHVRIVMGMVIGLAMARLLTGIAGLIQHPGRHRVSALHLLWVASILIELVLFWWWEFALSRVDHWSFGVFLFLIAYAVLLYLLSALLFPDNISEYGSYENFFIKRRRWFFALFATTFLFDVIDTLIKGADYLRALNRDYLIQVPIGLSLSVVACASKNRNLQIGIVLIHLAYQAYWISRTFGAPV